MNDRNDSPKYPDESKQIIGCAMCVHNGVGHGFHEKPYENALMIEFRERGVVCDQQSRFSIFYKQEKIGEYIPDLIVYKKIIIDTKVIDRITNIEVGQMLKYLKITGLELGYIINFKHPRLEWKRVVL